jgi:hypothetical protein
MHYVGHYKYKIYYVYIIKCIIFLTYLFQHCSYRTDSRHYQSFLSWISQFRISAALVEVPCLSSQSLSHKARFRPRRGNFRSNSKLLRV